MSFLNRAKVVFFNRLDILAVLNGQGTFKGLPEDAYITGFFSDWVRNGMGVHVCSNTFPEVPHGQVLEEIQVEFVLRPHVPMTTAEKCYNCGKEKDTGVACWWCGHQQ